MLNINKSKPARFLSGTIGVLTTASSFFASYPVQGALDVTSSPLNNIEHIIVIYQENWSFDALYGNFPGANGVANASPASLTQIDRLNGNSLNAEQGLSTFNRYTGSGTVPTGNTNSNPGFLNDPPQPLNGVVDTRFNTNSSDPNSPLKVNTLLPYLLPGYPDLEQALRG